MVSPLNNVMVTGSIQAVSRFTAQTDAARAAQAAGLRMHLVVGVPVALAFAAAAPLIAWAFGDGDKAAPIALAALIVGGYAFYAVFVGAANGRRQFHKQAGLDMLFATLRAVAILGAAGAGLGVIGVIGGWVAAVVGILVVAALWVGLPGKVAPAERQPIGPMVRFFAGVALYLALFNALMFVDTWLLKAQTASHFADAGARLPGALVGGASWLSALGDYRPAPAALADVQVAYYAAAQNLARLSYQAIIAATFVVFPLVSKSTFSDDRDTTRTYVQVTARYSLIFATAIGVAMAANPGPILDVVYPTDYAVLGGPALAALAIGNVAFSLFAIGGTILNGAGYTRDAILTAGATLALAAIGNLVAIPMAEPGRQALAVAASVTGASMVVGAVLTGVVLHRRLGAFLPLASVARVVLAVGVAWAVGALLPSGGALVTLAEAAITAIVFLAVLVASRELGRRDLAAISAVRKKRGQGVEA